METATPSEKRVKVLAVEDDANTRSLIALSLETVLEVEAITADSVDLAIALLDHHDDVRCIICDYHLEGKNGGVLFKHLQDSQLTIPFILITADDPASLPEFCENPPAARLRKPFLADSLLESVRQAAGLGEETANAQDISEFCRVPITILLEMGQIRMDAYVRLSQDKFVRVLKRGDLFQAKDAERFLLKGIDALYARREDCRRFLDDLSQHLLDLAAKNASGFDAARIITTSALEIIHDITARLGITEETQKLIHSATDFAVSVIERSPVLGRLFGQAKMRSERYIVDHSVILAHFSCAFAATQAWRGVVTFRQLTLAAFLHDITLPSDELARIQTYDEFALKRSEFTEAESYAFLNHTKEAAALARQLTEAPPDVDTLILQHHERPGGTGFPHHLDHSSLRPIVCAFILGHELTTYLDRGGQRADLLDWVHEMSKKYKAGAFVAILQGIAQSLAQDAMGR
jgi:response regulator RpfG family c-di-GMP phosphodiesterase